MMENKAKARTLCISLYESDIEHLDRFVFTLKQRGARKATRSAAIRAGLSLLYAKENTAQPQGD